MGEKPTLAVWFEAMHQTRWHNWGKKAQCLELCWVLMGFIFVCELIVSPLSCCHHSTASSCWKLSSLSCSTTNMHVLIITVFNGLYRVNDRSTAAIFTFLQWKSPREKKRWGWGRDPFFLLSTQCNYIPNGEFMISYLVHNEYSMWVTRFDMTLKRKSGSQLSKAGEPDGQVFVLSSTNVSSPWGHY